MNDESSSTNTSETSLLKKITRIFSPNPTSSDEVADMLRSAENESIIDAGALQIMEGALKVSDLQAREIMIPRSQMKFIEADLSLEEILNIVIQSQHSRFPVVGESSDDIQGILLAKELLICNTASAGGFPCNATSTQGQSSRKHHRRYPS